MELIAPVLLLGGLTLALGWLLTTARARLQDDDSGLIDAIDALLPQTQCAQCGYPGCRPYAEAVAAGAAIDLCPPGGKPTFEALQALLGRTGGNAPPAPAPALARIREQQCIGCFLCIHACPVDAIIGAPGFMHTVVEQECTGCELCIPACPVDCIDLIPCAVEPPERDTHIAQMTEQATEQDTHLSRTGQAATEQDTHISRRGQTAEQDTHISPTGQTEQDTHLPSGSATRPETLATGFPTAQPNTGTGRSSHDDAGQPCIGCNRCEPVCPVNLAPRELLWLRDAERLHTAAQQGLERCIECRLCDRVCPSDIPLAAIFAAGKRALAEASAQKAQAAHAKARFEARAARIADQRAAAQARRAARLSRQQHLTRQAGPA